MNQKKTTTSKQKQLVTVAIIATSVVAAAMIVGINNSQNLQKVMAQEVYPSGKNTAASSSTTAVAVKAVSPNQSTNKEFWINTVHLDGMTNINAVQKIKEEQEQASFSSNAIYEFITLLTG